MSHSHHDDTKQNQSSTELQSLHSTEPRKSQGLSEQMPDSHNECSRRSFVQATAAAMGATSVIGSANLSLARSAHAFGSDTVRIGLIGAGGRGTGAVIDAFKNPTASVQLSAVGDCFGDRLEASLETLNRQRPDQVQVPDSQKFVGFDAYKRVIDTDCDFVILTTPPGFRPLHFEAAIQAGKHVFMEKPVAVDAPGVRRVLAAGELATQKGLIVQVGLQRRHEFAYRETIQQLQDGIIGDLICSRVYWNNPGVWVNPRRPEQTELEYQMRNWYYFNWICGDHICEQHIHNIDVINWLMNDYPKSAQGQGGRLVRSGKEYGQIYDHHSVEYTYENGHKMFSMCRHMPDTWNQVAEFVHGSEGWADISRGRIYDKDGETIFQTQAARRGYVAEHEHMFEALIEGNRPNETEYAAKSTFTSILGRLATYTGKYLNWDEAINSNISLADVDALKSMDDQAPVLPDEEGRYPIPLPGKNLESIIDF